VTEFTDTKAALEEAEYLANLHNTTHCIVHADKNVMVVIPKHEAVETNKPILESILPTKLFSIYD